MPPEVSPCQPIFTPFIQEPPRSTANQPFSNEKNRGTKGMMITKRKLIPILVLILSGVSMLRLLKITVITSFYSPPCSSSSACKRTTPLIPGQSKNQPFSYTLTNKEYQFLSNIISQKAPCNLLVFGLEPEYLDLSTSINGGGTTIILEDDPKKLTTAKRKNRTTQIYKVEYNTRAGDAYKLLKHVREEPACALHSGSLRKSKCILALKKLPHQVYKRKWDVVVVDGPSGDKADAPGRMATIYTAGMIAQAGSTTDVVVHDIDRMIEKWFAWEFLCEENFVSSKVKLWHFRIAARSDSTRFCTAKTSQMGS